MSAVDAADIDKLFNMQSVKTCGEPSLHAT